MNLNILYEDNHLIVVIKEMGILSQADHTNDIDMLTIIKQYLRQKYHKEGNVYLGLVMRLDRMTSGVMVFAKTSKAASRLCEQIRNKKFVKKYLAVVEGILEQNDHLENYLYKDDRLVKSFVTIDQNLGKYAALDYEVVKKYDDETLIKVNLLTGRHHQIRVQMANVKHPLKGDTLYGSKNMPPFLLHAYYLSFYHPITKEQLVFENYPRDNKYWKKYFN